MMLDTQQEAAADNFLLIATKKIGSADGGQHIAAVVRAAMELTAAIGFSDPTKDYKLKKRLAQSLAAIGTSQLRHVRTMRAADKSQGDLVRACCSW